MPGFNFARGNAKKLLSLPLYALGVSVSVFVPRTNSRWVFGSGSGIGEGALELYRYAHSRNPALKLVWLAANERDLAAAASIGVPAVLKMSALGLWLSLRAGVIVVTHGFGDANRYGTRGSFVVQLWHGIPLKLIQLDSPVTTASGILSRSALLRRLLRRAYRRGYRGIRLMPASSELVASRLRTAFGIPAGDVVVTGDPRDDVLCRGTADERSDRARAVLLAKLALDPATNSRILLYAPTWRDGAPDPGAPSITEWRRIDEYLLATDTILVVRPHPHGVGDYEAGIRASQRAVLLSTTAQPDVTPVLAAADLLVTDYSSIAFDYSLTGGPIFLLAPDEEEYTGSRGLYEPYREFSDGREVRSWTALLDQLDRFDRDPEWAQTVRAHSERLAERHFAFRDGRNTERVYDQILDRLKAQQ